MRVASCAHRRQRWKAVASQTGLAFGQAHYDWAQTRFEDLTASAEELVDVAKLLESSAAAFAGQDQRTQQVLNSIVTALGTHPGGEHP